MIDIDHILCALFGQQPWASCSHLMCLCSPSSIIWFLARAFMLMCRNVAAGIGSNEQGEYCRAALQRSDLKEPRYNWPTLLFFTFYISFINSQNTTTNNCSLAVRCEAAFMMDCSRSRLQCSRPARVMLQ